MSDYIEAKCIRWMEQSFVESKNIHRNIQDIVRRKVYFPDRMNIKVAEVNYSLEMAGFRSLSPKRSRPSRLSKITKQAMSNKF